MKELREVMRKWVTGVSVVTAEHQGLLHGMTVGSLVSISINPPRIAVTLANQTRTFKIISQSGNFGVTLLAGDQESIAGRFSGAVPDQENRFAGVRVRRMIENIPVLEDGLGQLACRVVHQYAMPDSTLLVGEVLETYLGSANAALAYGNRRYHIVEL